MEEKFHNPLDDPNKVAVKNINHKYKAYKGETNEILNSIRRENLKNKLDKSCNYVL